MKVFGIPNCDTCRKARKWLDEQGLAYEWRDLREPPGVEADRLDRWLAELGPAALVNKRSTTWRGLDKGQRATAEDASTARDLLLEHPTLIKRPVIESGPHVFVGFTDSLRTALAGDDHG